jgi:hypothetical protein
MTDLTATGINSIPYGRLPSWPGEINYTVAGKPVADRGGRAVTP